MDHLQVFASIYHLQVILAVSARSATALGAFAPTLPPAVFACSARLSLCRASPTVHCADSRSGCRLIISANYTMPLLCHSPTRPNRHRARPRAGRFGPTSLEAQNLPGWAGPTRNPCLISVVIFKLVPAISKMS